LDGKTFYLGTHGSEASRALYNRLLAEWLANGRRLPVERRDDASFTVADLIDAYLDHAEREYVDQHGKPTREVVNLRYPLRLLNETFGDTAAAAFGPRDLKLLRDRMIAKGWCRRLVNQRIGIVRRAFRWAVEDERLPAAVLVGLQAVRGLKRGRGGVAETEPVQPVTRDQIRRTVPFLTPTLRAMVWLQWCTGARPGEVCHLHVEEIATDRQSLDKTPIWIADLASHKNAIRGKQRRIAIGPRAQKVIRRYVDGRTSGYVFQPEVSEAERHADLRARRVTPIGPRQAARDESRRQNPKRELGEHFSTLTMGRAIARAAKRAGVPAWSPNQIRHAAATRLRLLRNLETSGACLGHARLETTQLYANTNESLAINAMAQFG
jgi:integrase